MLSGGDLVPTSSIYFLIRMHFFVYWDIYTVSWHGFALSSLARRRYMWCYDANLVTWYSKSVVAYSGAKLRTIVTLTAWEMIWVGSLLKDMGNTDPSHMSNYCDKQAATFVASNPFGGGGPLDILRLIFILFTILWCANKLLLNIISLEIDLVTLNH